METSEVVPIEDELELGARVQFYADHRWVGHVTELTREWQGDNSNLWVRVKWQTPETCETVCSSRELKIA
ncbi:hypothetical protein PP304_gp175 [Gordonia phage Phendrix]|uniref:Uncharacterized protein n=1 Tax=Gordonia phage Phendrix TaxID=2593335 RepID=A0A514U175_9CAUD|nr:hypothetical protein PP304_gp175 [Gordonia phage Phendrix]QDK02694.1 hypothetical protein SEA_PHENDRIX_178 [Gordonia phage Phendrix]